MTPEADVGRTTRRQGTLIAAMAVVMALVMAVTGGAAGKTAPVSASTGSTSPACPLGLTGTSYPAPPGGVAYTVCGGRVASFDGTPLDAGLTLPAGGQGALPLMVMLHGWGNSKTDFEATGLAGNGANTWHWNNVWFAAHGFAVLTYTARGFHRSCGQDPASGYSYVNDPACQGRASWTHLADRRWEVHDTQYLTGLLVDAGVADPSRVVVTGDSYGGGQSWLLALSQNRVMLPDGSLVPWKSPAGVPIHLAAAAPQFTWTDLAQALTDNGQGSDGYFGAPPPGPHESPYGVEKQSYTDGLFADGGATAQYAGPDDPTADLPGWFAAISAGEPAAQNNPLVAQALTQLETYRSPFYLPVPPPGRQVPVFAPQGVTDPLFPGIQVLQMVNKLTAAYHDYPVWTALGDLGHSYAANPHALWVTVNNEANTFLTAVLAGQHPALPRFTLTTVGCLPGQPVTTYQASSFPRLATGLSQYTAPGPVTVVSDPSPVPGPEAVATDPIANSGCRVMNTTTDPGVAAWTWSPAHPVTLIGAPVVRVTVALDGTDTELAARLWDVDPATGEQALITRAVYRLTAPAPGSTQQLAFELWPTGWALGAGHQLKLELTPDDSPTWRPDNLPASMTLTGISLTIPVRAR
ncbi:MAG TPA: CocE/NonD family hydrolase C-terminal non-catalytic domain-containing protein [Streptosporangiaceae bacterium]|nr:CocE/NonD family hydrolase C-terminal non-catalytic domain-containing protein [Streptosporangiaceae bacterium]